MRETSREEDGIHSCKRASEGRKMGRVDEKRHGYEVEITSM